MAQQETATRRRSASSSSAKKEKSFSYCSLPHVAERVLSPNVNPARARFIIAFGNKWVNETVLRYYFFDKETDGEHVTLNDGTREWRTWTADNAEKDIVRRGFKVWKEVGIGLKFQEVDSREDAEIRIGFMRGDGAWSYVGRDILGIGQDARTMNFGWDLTRRREEIDTAVHEIGHTLGLRHEHQNPNAGIVWDEQAVYAALAGAPNFWSRDVTYRNIIRKIDPDTVQGSSWDPDSIMHYPFGAGLIEEPERFQRGLTPALGLSNRDTAWIQTYYPSPTETDYAELRPFHSVELEISAGGQRNFVIKPNSTREYNIGTFGTSDTVIVLFEEDNGDLRYLKGDDDSGEDSNASIRVRLVKNRTYVLRVRLYYSDRIGETAVMLW